MEILSSLNNKEWLQYREQIFTIFLQNSIYLKEEKNKQEERFQTWVESYYSRYPDWFFIILDDNKVEAYLAICPDSSEALSWINVKSYQMFKEYYKDHPFHLHINVSLSSQGKGLGSLILNHALQKIHQPIHLITEKKHKNYSFYIKNQFKPIASKALNGAELILMSR